MAIWAPKGFGIEVGAQSRAYSYTCPEYSYLQAETGIYFRDQVLVRGTSVKLIAGWSGYRVIQEKISRTEQPILWADRIEVPMKPFPNGIWMASPSHPLHTRGSNEYYTALDFVFEITPPSGKVYYENGSGTRWGFFRLAFDTSKSLPCVDFGIPPPNYATQPVRIIRRD